MPFITISEYINRHSRLQAIDIRSAADYAGGHLPAALSLPIHIQTEEVRNYLLSRKAGQAVIPEQLIPDLPLVSEKLQLLNEQYQDLVLYDETGSSLAGVLEQSFRAKQLPYLFLHGGIQQFRNYQQNFFAREWQFIVITGKTGCGKTQVLAALQQAGAQVLDLEALSGHRGSVFGADHQSPEITTQAFHNRIWLTLNGFDATQPVFLEQKGSYLGRHQIPSGIWQRSRQAKCIRLLASVDFRVDHLTAQYAHLSVQQIATALRRLRSKMPPTLYQDCLDALENTDRKRFVRTILQHYDRSKMYQFYEGREAWSINTESGPPAVLAARILSSINMAHTP